MLEQQRRKDIEEAAVMVAKAMVFDSDEPIRYDPDCLRPMASTEKCALPEPKYFYGVTNRFNSRAITARKPCKVWGRR